MLYYFCKFESEIFFKDLFLMWTIFVEVIIEFVTTMFLFYILVF